MLIFNCSKAFAEFIDTKTGTGTPPLVTLPPSPDPTNDAELLTTGIGAESHDLQQWVLHLVQIRRQPCVVAMEVETRYAMLFTGLKKGDVTGFVNQFIERLANSQCFAARDLGMLIDFEAALSQFTTRHHKLRFFLRPHRSAQAHIKEVVWLLEQQFAKARELPVGHTECAAFDKRINDFLRKTATHRDYFVPAEEMLVTWLACYAGLTPAGEPHLRLAFRQHYQARMTGNAQGS